MTDEAERYDEQPIHIDELTTAQKTFIEDQAPQPPAPADNPLLKPCPCTRFGTHHYDCPVCGGRGWIPSEAGLKITQLLNTIKEIEWLHEHVTIEREEADANTDKNKGKDPDKGRTV
jgi:hypothetical protein